MLARLGWNAPEPAPTPRRASAADVESALMLMTFAAGYVMALIGLAASLTS